MSSPVGCSEESGKLLLRHLDPHADDPYYRALLRRLLHVPRGWSALLASHSPRHKDLKERLSFGITLLLVVEVMRGTVASFVPICGELLRLAMLW